MNYFKPIVSWIIVLWATKVFLFLASTVMAGAVFFHLFTPLGIEVLHEGKSDGGSLFYSAVSILVLGLVLFFINRSGLFKNSLA